MDLTWHYLPILKGRMGEFRALEEWKDAPPEVTPMIELVPTGVEITAEGEAAPESLRKSLLASATRIQKSWPGRRLILDASLMPGPPEGGDPPIVTAMAQFGIVHDVIPAVRPSDGGKAIRRIAAAGLTGACIRLSGEDLDDTDRPIADAVEDVLDQLALTPGAIDLVLDFEHVEDERAAAFAARIARLVLGDVPRLEEWRTVTVAGGAFPSDLNNVPAEVLTDLPRHDVELWNAVTARFRDRTPTFGDYAIAHPRFTMGPAFAPAPQLRYTAEGRWLVMKGRRNERRGARQFFDICARITELSDFRAGLSWGDRLIERAAGAALDDDPSESTGNAMTWRAIGTSHHLAVVVSRLANGLVP